MWSSTARSPTATNGDKPPRMKMTKESPEISILSLPYDLLLNIIARVSRLYYPTLSLVSKKFRSVVASPDLYETRSRSHLTENCLYICLRYSNRRFPLNIDTYWFALCRKPNRTTTDGSSGHIFIPITSPQLRPARSTSLVAVGSNIYRIGGDMPSSSRVSVLDCRFNTWHSAPKMREKRVFPAASVVDGKIYVAGGCEDPRSVDLVEVFDPKTGTWGNVANPGTETRPRAEVTIFGIEGKLYLLGDENEDVVYDPKEARWNPIGLGIDKAFAAHFHYCVIGDVMFLWDDREFRWFDCKVRSWKKFRGVEDLPDFHGYCKMVDHGGNMVLLWDDYLRSEHVAWCAEIALEMRDGDEMWGIVEWCDVVLSLNEPFRMFDAVVLSPTV